MRFSFLKLLQKKKFSPADLLFLLDLKKKKRKEG